jgi:hypothetical protein
MAATAFTAASIMDDRMEARESRGGKPVLVILQSKELSSSNHESGQRSWMIAKSCPRMML